MFSEFQGGALKLLRVISWDRGRLALLGVILALAALGAGAYRYFRPDDQLAKVRELGSQLRTAARQMPGDQRRQLGKELRDEMRKLNPEQRRELREDRQDRWRQQMRKFFQLSKEDQTTYLDRLIKQGEERRQRWQNRNDNNPQAEERRQRSQEQNANGDRAGRGRRGGNGSPEERESRRKQALDRSTPEDRAMRAEFRKMMQERRQQLGLPTQGGGGGRGRGQRT
jgi:hypothetical protein